MQLRQPLNLRQPLQMTAHKIRPTLNLPFASSGTLGPLITFTRSSPASYFNSSGTLTSASTDTARFDYNPSTLIARGLLIEEARTNLFLNSLINGTNLSTQNVTTAATPYTLSFYGTGTITLSGTSVGSLVGSGAYPIRSTLTFTPSAGTLTCTVTGTVQYAQIEAGSFATSFIPTAGVTVTRAADLASITGANFTSFWNATQGTIVVGFMNEANVPAATFPTVVRAGDGTTNNFITINQINTGNRTYAAGRVGGVDQWDINSGSATYNTTALTAYKSAIAYQANNIGYSLAGTAAGTDTSATIPTVDRLEIGSANSSGFVNGWISSLSYYPVRLTNTQLQTLST